MAKWVLEPKPPDSHYSALPTREGSIKWCSLPVGVVHKDGSICGQCRWYTELFLSRHSCVACSSVCLNSICLQQQVMTGYSYLVFWGFWIIYSLCSKRAYPWPISGDLYKSASGTQVPEASSYFELHEAVLPGTWEGHLWLCHMHLPYAPLWRLLLLSSALAGEFRDGHCSSTDPLAPFRKFWCCFPTCWHFESFREEAGLTGQGWLWDSSVLLMCKNSDFSAFDWYGAWDWIDTTTTQRMCWFS